MKRSGGFVEVKLVPDVSALKKADLPVVESRVIGDGVAVHDKTVVGDDGNFSGLGLFEDLTERKSIDGGDYEHVAASGYHVFYLCDLSGDIVVASVLEVDGVARLFKL